MVRTLTKEQLETAKVLRAQNITWRDIAKQLGASEGALKASASRNGWAKHVSSVTRATANIVMGRMEDEINVCIAGAIELAKDGLDGLRSNKTKGMKPKDLREYAGALKELVAVQRQALGMSDKIGTQVNIGIIEGEFNTGQATSNPPPSDSQSDAPGSQTIDVD